MVWITVQLLIFNLFSFIANQSGVRFIASKLGSPDLPPWLRLEQREVTDRAFIYGTPGRDVSSQVVLEVGIVLSTAYSGTLLLTKKTYIPSGIFQCCLRETKRRYPLLVTIKRTSSLSVSCWDT